jgi:hypothetical protein
VSAFSAGQRCFVCCKAAGITSVTSGSIERVTRASACAQLRDQARPEQGATKCLQFFGHGCLAGERILQDRCCLHPGRSGPRMDRGGTVGKQHLDQWVLPVTMQFVDGNRHSQRYRLLVIIRKNNGTKRIAITVAATMPPMTPVPIECRLAEPAPVLMASGSTPRMNASDVITIGRKRSRTASMAASCADRPR